MGGIPIEIEVRPSLTQYNFIISQVLENCLMGPRGEGKTEAGIMAMTFHAEIQPRESLPVPWAILRDTWTNLERTTLASFLAPRPGSFAAAISPKLKVKEGGRVLELPGLWKANLFGMDSLSDLNKLQSLQLGGLWLEEPAPAAAEDIGGGLEERTITVGITSLRHPCARRAQITMNYPDEDHWTWIRYGKKRHHNRALFRIPRGENLCLDDDYRKSMEDALQGDQGMLDRLVLGKPGFVVQGEKVTPEYDPSIHRAEVDLEPQPNIPGYRFWDGGLNPTCVIAQLTPRGYLHIYETLLGYNIGVRQLIADQVKPAMRERYHMIIEWVDIGDPSMGNREASDSGMSAASVIQGELKTGFIGGPVLWGRRREGLKTALMKKIDDRPFLLLSAGEKYLHRALRGGWHYRKDSSGRIMTDKPVKDIHSHPGDALSYGVCRILKLDELGRMGLHNRNRVISDWDPYASSFGG